MYVHLLNYLEKVKEPVKVCLDQAKDEDQDLDS